MNLYPYYWPGPAYAWNQGLYNEHHVRFAEKMPHCMPLSEVNLRNAMRLLWEQHVAWTRMAIISIVHQLPDLDATLARLLQNAPDMGNALKPFYGEKAGDTFSQLIKDHLVIAADLVKAAKAGHKKAVDVAEKKWYANGDAITAFLAGINPYIDKEAFRNMFYEHLALTKTEAVTMLKKDYASSISTYDKIEKEALEMADTISDAIIKQFPTMFV